MLLEIKNVSKKFGKKIPVNNISFDIDNGEIVGFVGSNGSGKTTTIRLILEVLKRNGGEILFNGRELKTQEDRSKIAFFPDQNNFPRNFKIFDYIVYTARLVGISKKKAQEDTVEYLKLLGLGDYINADFSELSSGMQKKALLASILIVNPELIILDEPTANVDVETRIDFLSILKSLHDKGISILITTHIIDELDDLINKLVIIQDGKILYNNKFNHKNEKISEIYSRFVKSDKVNVKSIIDKVGAK